MNDAQEEMRSTTREAATLQEDLSLVKEVPLSQSKQTFSPLVENSSTPVSEKIMEETPSTMVITVVNNSEDDALIDPHLPIFDRSQEYKPNKASRSRFESVLLKGIERRLWLGLTSVSNRDFSKISIGSCAPFVFLINWTIQSGVSETFAFLKLRKVVLCLH
ncbi:BnaCnng30530D [Brassica napus]|uniref:BnaCnng30530D protein n=1 Tax=Brassica napus TaxID=3708 RepID=A0A078J0L0_BRANA|nr:BnaCnng30530D [Brassica napus]